MLPMFAGRRSMFRRKHGEAGGLYEQLLGYV
jgi:hypothetical protein